MSEDPAPRSQPGPLPVEEYLERMLSRIEPMQPFEHPLMDAIGLPVAEDILAPVSLPVFDNSGMDGYAVAFLAGTADVAERHGVPVQAGVVEDRQRDRGQDVLGYRKADGIHEGMLEGLHGLDAAQHPLEVLLD